MHATVRARLLLTFALGSLLLVAEVGAAQVGGPGGIRGNRPGMGGSNIGGGPPTMPNQPGGDIVGRPGGPVGGGAIGGGAIGGGPGRGGFGPTISTWHCPQCKREVGRGTFAPAMVNCCGNNYVNGKSLGTGFAPAPHMPNAEPGPPIGPATERPPAPEAMPPAENPAPAPIAPAAAPSDGGSNKSMLILLGVGIIVVGLMILGGIVLLILQGGRRSAPPPRRRRVRD